MSAHKFNKQKNGSAKTPGKLTKRSEPKVQRGSSKSRYKPRVKKTVDSGPSKIVLFNKPFDVRTHCTDDQHRKPIKDYIGIPHVYAAGRRDKDSEGLLLLTNDGKLQNQLADPKHKKAKVYWVQVEGAVTDSAITNLQNGVELKDGLTKPAKVKVIETPNVWQRTPPIRERKNIPTTWLQIEITEGKNRQVRRMTANVGFPTLRLIRYAIGEYNIGALLPGEHKLIQS